MRLSTSLLFAAPIFYAVASTASGKVCLPSSIEVLILQDVTNPWERQLRVVGRTIRRVLSRLERSYKIKYGISHFTDKPNAIVGIGKYGGFPDGRNESWCYQSHTPLQDAATAIASWESFMTSRPYEAGMDFDEAQFEALQRAVLDDSVGWSNSSETKKIIWLITDSTAHDGSVRGKRLADAISRFNGDWSCQSDLEKREFNLSGGFGAPLGVPEPLWAARPEVYKRAAELNVIRGCRFQSLSAAEVAEYIRLYQQLQPTWVYEAQRYHYGKLKSSPEAHCRENEYPSAEQVDDTLSEANTDLFLTIVGGDDDVQYFDTLYFWQTNSRTKFLKTRNTIVAVPQADIFTLQSKLVEAFIDFLPTPTTDCQ